MPDSSFDIIVIGSGIAGLTATKHLLQTAPELKIGNFESGTFGGLVTNINELDGAMTGSGLDLAADLMVEVTELGASTLPQRVVSLAKHADGWAVSTDGDENFRTRAVIIASGATLKKLGVPGEDQFQNKGISYCADCDGPMFKGQDVVVAGGGDSALQEARVLASMCRQVHIVNRGAQFTAKQHLIDAISGCENLVVLHNSQPKAILGENSVQKVQVLDLTDNTVSEIACNGFFGFVGLQPSSDFVPSSVPRDADGFIVTDPSSLKAGDLLFVAGAVRAGHGGMLEDAVTEGRIAAAETLKALSASARDSSNP